MLSTEGQPYQCMCQFMHSNSNDFIIILYSVQSQWTEVDATSHRPVEGRIRTYEGVWEIGKEGIHTTTKVSGRLSIGGIYKLANLGLLYISASHTQTFVSFVSFLIYI